MSLNKTIQTLTLVFVSFQGFLLLLDPDHRNRLYTTVAAVSDVGIPVFQQIAEHGRLIIALAMLPTCLYPRSWIVPKFISLMAYVFYICIIYNLYLFHNITNIAHFLFQLYVLIKILFIIVDDLTIIELDQRILLRKKSMSERSQKAESLKKQQKPCVVAQQTSEVKSRFTKKQQQKPKVVQNTKAADKPKKK